MGKQREKGWKQEGERERVITSYEMKGQREVCRREENEDEESEQMYRTW